MTLGELMIAASVLLVCLTALATLLGGSITSSRMARVRDEATNLANERIEIARSLAYDRVGLHYANGAWGSPAGDILTPEQVGSFVVTTECTWVRTALGRAAYKKLVVRVAWQQPIPGQIEVTTMLYGKSELVTSGDLVVKLRYRENGEPVQNATVQCVSSDNAGRSVLSDAAGESFFGQIALGAATLAITPPAGHVVDTSTMSAVSISADSVTTIIVYVQEPSYATVRVTETSGNAVTAAAVNVRRADGTVYPTVLTDTGGDARVPDLVYGDYTATVSKAGYPPATARIVVSAHEPEPIVEVTLSPIIYVGITVQVLDANQTPLPGATATLRREGDSNPLQTGVAGTNGAVSFTGLEIGTYQVTVEKQGWVSQTRSTYLQGGDQDTVTFHLSPTASQGNMRIVTRDKFGNLASLRVIVSGPNGYYRTNLYSGADGLLELTDLMPGSYQVRCYTRPASTATVLVNAGQIADVQISQR